MNDLFESLGIKPSAEAKPGTGLTIASTDQPTAKVKSLSPHAVEVDEWGARRGRELLDESPRLQQSELTEEAVADFHAAAFDPDPKLTEGCTDAVRHQFVKELFDTPEYRELHASTQLNSIAASIAATAFGEQYAVLKERTEEIVAAGWVAD